MAESDVDVIRSGYEAFNRGDLDAFFETVDPDIEWTPGALLLEGTIHGSDEMRRMFESFMEAFEEIRFAPVLIEEGVEDGQVVGVVDTTTRGKGSGAEVTVRVAHLLRLRDGKVVWGRVYPKASEGLSAAGLDPSLAGSLRTT
jgi:uncharacterized protein